MNLNKISLSLICLLLLFAIFCSVNIGMSWDEPQRHWQGAIRADYLKSLSLNELDGLLQERIKGFDDGGLVSIYKKNLRKP